MPQESENDRRQTLVRYCLERAQKTLQGGLHWTQIEAWISEARRHAADSPLFLDEIEQAERNLRNGYRQHVQSQLDELPKELDPSDPEFDNLKARLRQLENLVLNSPFEAEFRQEIESRSKDLRKAEAGQSYEEAKKEVDRLWEEGDAALKSGRGNPDEIIEKYFWEAVRVARGAASQRTDTDAQLDALVHEALQAYNDRRSQRSRAQTYDALQRDDLYLRELREAELKTPSKLFTVIDKDGISWTVVPSQGVALLAIKIVDRAQISAQRNLKTARKHLEEHNPKAADLDLAEVRRLGKELVDIDELCRWDDQFQGQVISVEADVEEALKKHQQAEELIKAAQNGQISLTDAWQHLQDAHATYQWVPDYEAARDYVRTRAQREFDNACAGVYARANSRQFPEAREELDVLRRHTLLALKDHDIFRTDITLDPSDYQTQIQRAGEYISKIEQEQKDLQHTIPTIEQLIRDGDFRGAQQVIDEFQTDHPPGVRERSRDLNALAVQVSANLDARQLEDALKGELYSDDLNRIRSALETAQRFIDNNIDQAEQHGIVRHRNLLENRLRFHTARTDWLRDGNSDEALRKLEGVINAGGDRTLPEDQARAVVLRDQIGRAIDLQDTLALVLPDIEQKVSHPTANDLVEALDELAPYMEVTLPPVGVGRQRNTIWKQLRGKLAPKLKRRARTLLRANVNELAPNIHEEVAQILGQLKKLEPAELDLARELSELEAVLRAKKAEQDYDWSSACEAWQEANELSVPSAIYRSEYSRALLFKGITLLHSGVDVGVELTSIETPAEHLDRINTIDRNCRMRQVQDLKLHQLIHVSQEHLRQVNKHLRLIAATKGGDHSEGFRRFLSEDPEDPRQLEVFGAALRYMHEPSLDQYQGLKRWWLDTSQSLHANLLDKLNASGVTRYWEVLDPHTRLLLLDPENVQAIQHLAQLPRQVEELRRDVQIAVDSPGEINLQEPIESVNREIDHVNRLTGWLGTVQSVERVLTAANLVQRILPPPQAQAGRGNGQPSRSGLVLDVEITALGIKKLDVEITALGIKKKELEEVNRNFSELIKRLGEAVREYSWRVFDENLADLKRLPHQRWESTRPDSDYSEHASAKYLDRLRQEEAEKQTQTIKQWLGQIIEVWALDVFLSFAPLEHARSGFRTLALQPGPGVAYTRLLDSNEWTEFPYKRYGDWEEKKNDLKRLCEQADFDQARQETQAAIDKTDTSKRGMSAALSYLQQHPEWQLENLATIGDAAHLLALLRDDLRLTLQGHLDEARIFCDPEASPKANDPDPRRTIKTWEEEFRRRLREFEGELRRMGSRPTGNADLRRAWERVHELAPHWDGLAEYEDYTVEQN